MVTNGYEIDFIPVDSGKKNGDAISIRVRKNGIDQIYVIDGGTKESGEKLVEHVKTYYNSTKVDFLISTHPDLDHISGLITVLENLDVKEVWMHKPWEHSSNLIKEIIDARVTENSLTNRLRNSLKQAVKIEEIAISKGIKVKEPFQGCQIGVFKVLSPEKLWYIELIKSFNNMPSYESKTDIVKGLGKIVEKVKTVFENWNIETLSEDGETSAKNESSVVLFGTLPSINALFTGDAGLMALNKAYNYAESIGFDIKTCDFLQIPHHGGRRNVSPSILNKLIGPKLPENHPASKYGFVNVSKDSTTHPKKSVSNAFKRRGVNVCVPNGFVMCKSDGFSIRPNWGSISPLKFFTQVEG